MNLEENIPPPVAVKIATLVIHNCTLKTIAGKVRSQAGPIFDKFLTKLLPRGKQRNINYKIKEQFKMLTKERTDNTL